MIKKMVIYALFGVAVCVWSHGQVANDQNGQKIEQLSNEQKSVNLSQEKSAGVGGVAAEGVVHWESPKTAPEISAEEQLQLRNTQVDIMQTYQLLLDLQGQQKKIMATLYEKYHISPDQFVACDGPGPKPCDTVPHGKIAFKKKEAEKK